MGKAIIIDQGDETEGLEREGLDGGGIGEGWFEETNPCLNFTLTVPPAVELLNYMRSGPLFRIFSPKTGIFRGFSQFIINFGGRIIKVAMGGRGASSASFCVLQKLKRRVRAWQGHAHRAETHYLYTVTRPKFGNRPTLTLF